MKNFISKVVKVTSFMKEWRPLEREYAVLSIFLHVSWLEDFVRHAHYVYFFVPPERFRATTKGVGFNLSVRKKGSKSTSWAILIGTTRIPFFCRISDLDDTKLMNYGVAVYRYFSFMIQDYHVVDVFTLIRTVDAFNRQSTRNGNERENRPANQPWE